MPNSIRFLSLTALLMLLAVSSVASRPPESSSREINEEFFEWCLSQFPDEDEQLAPLRRPWQKLAPLVLNSLVTPADLVVETESSGRLPAEIERYRGRWIWPSVGQQAPSAIFVERLTPDEMTIVLARKRDKIQSGEDSQAKRMKLKWSGSKFALKTVSADSTDEIEISISRSGEAMLVMSMHSEIVILEGPDGISEGPFGEAWPGCFVSSKHY